MTDRKLSVLFVCTGNAGRSQMAQALLRKRVGDAVGVESAGVKPWDHLHPQAVRQMEVQGLSLGEHFPKPVEAVDQGAFDLVVTIGDPARALLPRARLSSAYWVHWDIADPADADGTPDSETVFRATARDIEDRLPDLCSRLTELPAVSQFANQPGIGTGLWGKQRFIPREHLPLIANAGFRALELNLYKGPDHFDWEDRAALHELRQVADGLDVLVWSIHSPDVGSVASPDESERRRQIHALRKCVDLADELGAKVVVSHALLSGPFEEDPGGCEERMAAFLAGLAQQAEASVAQVGFENAGSTAHDAIRTDRLFEKLDRASRAAYGFVLDTGHSNIAGDLTRISETIGDRLLSVHLNDNDSTGDSHGMPGEGTVDWSCVRRLLESAGYRGVQMYEIEPGTRDPAELLTATMARHREIWPARSG